MRRNNKKPHKVDKSKYKKSATTLEVSNNRTHEVGIVDKDSKTKGKSSSSWFMKAVNSMKDEVTLPTKIMRLEALRETYSQEIFRLFDPFQPKTRPVFTEDGHYYILSRAIDGFHSFDDLFEIYDHHEIFRDLKEGIINNLGTNCGTLLLVNDIDHNTNNFGVNDDNLSIKIDSGWAFARLIIREMLQCEPTWSGFPAHSKYNITPDVIASLPKLNNKDYSAYNFGSQIFKGETKTPNLLPSLNQRVFRRELNHNLLKQMVTPNRYFYALSQRHVETKEDEIGMDTAFVEIANRRLQALTSALSNAAFCQFLLSDEADIVVAEYDSYLHQDGKGHFKMSGKEPIWENSNAGILKEALESLRHIIRHPADSAERKQHLLTALKKLIAEIPSNEYGETPLHFAAIAGNIQFAEAALQLPLTDINACTIDTETPLTLALLYQNFDFAKFLLAQEGIDVTLKNKKNKSALDIVCVHMKMDLCLQLALLYPENHTFEELHENTVAAVFSEAIMRQDLAVLKRILNNPDIHKEVVTFSADYTTDNESHSISMVVSHLLSLVKNKDSDAVFHFLFEYQTQSGKTIHPSIWIEIMMRAIHGNQLDKCKFLLNHPQRPDLPANFFGEALQAAATKANTALVQYLLDNGADINFTSESSSDSPILQAAKHGKWKVVMLLAAHPACNVNAQLTKNNKTALHLAVEAGALDAAEALLKRGADLTLEDAKGKTPVKAKCTFKEDRKEMTALLAKYMAQEKVDTTALRTSGLHSPLLEKSGNIPSEPLLKK